MPAPNPVAARYLNLGAGIRSSRTLFRLENRIQGGAAGVVEDMGHYGSMRDEDQDCRVSRRTGALALADPRLSAL